MPYFWFSRFPPSSLHIGGRGTQLQRPCSTGPVLPYLGALTCTLATCLCTVHATAQLRKTVVEAQLCSLLCHQYFVAAAESCTCTSNGGQHACRRSLYFLVAVYLHCCPRVLTELRL